MQERLFIESKDIMIIEAVSYSTALRRMNKMKDSFGKSKDQKITIKAYCEFNDVDLADVKEMIFKK